MKLPINQFKQKLKAGETQIGLWIGLANSYSAEIAAVADFDWLLLDGEHAPNDLQSLLLQLQAIAPYRSHPIIRPPVGDTALIKQLLDIGAQTLLIPMIETAEQAEKMVQSIHYPPRGIRGVGSALARASRWNSIANYIHEADDEICLLLQIENKKGLDNLDEILAVNGVDGIFIGPADLSASLGHRNDPGHPEVQALIESTLKKIHAAGKASGILYANPDYAKRYLELGSQFVAVGVDTSLLINACRNLLAQFKTTSIKTDKDSIY